MAVRPSKQALTQIAARLDVDRAAARAYARRVQQLVGAVSFETIADAMLHSPSLSALDVAATIASGDTSPGQ